MGKNFENIFKQFNCAMQIVPLRAAPLWKHCTSTLEVRSPLIVDIWVNRISSGNGNFFINISRVLVNATAARIHPEILVKTPAYGTRRSCRNSLWQKTAACSSTKTKQNAAVRILKNMHNVQLLQLGTRLARVPVTNRGSRWATDIFPIIFPHLSGKGC